MEGGVWFSLGVFFKPLAETFGWSRAQTSAANTLFILAYGISTYGMSRFADRYGSRRVMAPAAAIVGLALIASGGVRGWWELLATYTFIGIGLGPTWVVPAVTTQRWFIKHRGAMLGVVLSGVGLGGLIYAPLANWLISAYGWRMAFVIIGLFSGAGLGVATLAMFHSPEQQGLQAYGRQEAVASPGEFPAWSERNLTTRQAIRHSAFWWLLAVLVLGHMPTLFITVHLVPYATDQGLSPAAAAAAVGLLGALSIPGRLFIGAVSDRIGWKGSFALANFGAAAAAAAMLAIGSPLTAYLIVASFGFFHGTRVPPTAGLVSFLFGTRSLSEITGILIGAAFVAGAFAPALAGFLFDRLGSYEMVILLSAASFAVGGLLLYFLHPPRPEGHPLREGPGSP